MDPITIGLLIVMGTIALVIFIMVKVEDWRTFHPRPSDISTYEYKPEECDHEWEYWDEQYETTISYSSYGGCDPMGTVTVHHQFCPKCGTHETTADDPVPNS